MLKETDCNPLMNAADCMWGILPSDFTRTPSQDSRNLGNHGKLGRQGKVGWSQTLNLSTFCLFCITLIVRIVVPNCYMI